METTTKENTMTTTATLAELRVGDIVVQPSTTAHAFLTNGKTSEVTVAEKRIEVVEVKQNYEPQTRQRWVTAYGINLSTGKRCQIYTINGTCEVAR